MTRDVEWLEKILVHSKEYLPFSSMVDENTEGVRAELEPKPGQYKSVWGLTLHINCVNLDSYAGQALSGLRFVRNKETLHLEDPRRKAVCNTQVSTDNFKQGPLLFQRQFRIKWKLYVGHNNHLALPFAFCSGCMKKLRKHIGGGSRIGRIFSTYWSEGLSGIYPEQLCYAFMDETDHEETFKFIKHGLTFTKEERNAKAVEAARKAGAW